MSQDHHRGRGSSPISRGSPGRGRSSCPGCALELTPSDGPVHAYIGASPSCWALYGRVLARAYEDPLCREVLQLVVDAYACQHPGVAGPRAAQSVALHLMTLCLFLEGGADPREGSALHREMVARPAYEWLEPPPERGRITVDALLGAQTSTAYVDAAWAWARDTWRAWQPHHDTVRAWAEPHGGPRRAGADSARPPEDAVSARGPGRWPASARPR